ncbi:MAG: 5,10-methylene tetrahydromethanopterin reductase, partial [Terrimesophilobacter sp.]
LVPEDFAESDQALRDGDIDKAVAAITPQMLRLGISGDPETVVARCQELKAAGVSHLSFGPPLGAEPVKAIELLGSEILPRLRK